MLHPRALASTIAASGKRICHLCDRLTGAARIRCYRISHRLEHLGFVAVAAVDAFHLHTYLFVVSLWLLATGIFAELFSIGGGE